MTFFSALESHHARRRCVCTHTHTSVYKPIIDFIMTLNINDALSEHHGAWIRTISIETLDVKNNVLRRLVPLSGTTKLGASIPTSLSCSTRGSKDRYKHFICKTPGLSRTLQDFLFWILTTKAHIYIKTSLSSLSWSWICFIFRGFNILMTFQLHL